MDQETLKLRRLFAQYLLAPASRLYVVRAMDGFQAQFLSNAIHAMRLRSADILGVKRPVVGLRIRILGHGFLGAFGKAAAPALVGLHGLSVFCKK